MRDLIRALAVALVIALVAVGCGDDSDDAADGDAATDETGTEDEAATDGGATTTADDAATDGEAATDDVEATTTTEAPVTETAQVDVPEYPYWDTPIVVPDQALLDELATDYVASTDDPQMERFLFGTVAVEVFDRIFAGVDPDDLPSLLWLMHLSGYFGGRWLRGVIADAQPDAPVVGFSSPPTEEAWQATLASTQLRLDALDLPDDQAIAVARESLFDKPPPAEGEDPIRGLTDNFGYNRGYMLETLATPPEGIEASPAFEVTCDGLFDCTYASPKLATLGELADVQAALNTQPPSMAPDLVDELRPIQDAAIPRGTAVWSGGLSVQGFSQESYDQLLDTSSSFLETVQATALSSVQAVDEQDAELARRAAAADAAMVVWLDAYFGGLTNGEGTIEIPTFA